MLAPTTLQPSWATSWATSLTLDDARPDRSALYISDCPDEEWELEKAKEYGGLLRKRPFHATEWDLSELKPTFGSFGDALGVDIDASTDPRQTMDTVAGLLARAALPEALSMQISEDALWLTSQWKALCPSARAIRVQLEVFGENTCARWHQDHFVGRAIVSYNGAVGTAYTSDGNVDFWQLSHGGNNEAIIRNAEVIEHVGVGDLLLIKGTKFPGRGRAQPLVHKSPEKRYHADGTVLNRLVLKVRACTRRCLCTRMATLHIPALVPAIAC